METIKILGRSVRQYKLQAILAPLTVSGEVIMEVLIPTLMAVLIDEGIDPGTEWDEYIAAHIDRCSYMIAFLSDNYFGSSNCRDELAFARDLDKPRLLVYIEQTKLPAGMA